MAKIVLSLSFFLLGLLFALLLVTTSLPTSERAIKLAHSALYTKFPKDCKNIESIRFKEAKLNRHPNFKEGFIAYYYEISFDVEANESHTAYYFVKESIVFPFWEIPVLDFDGVSLNSMGNSLKCRRE